jgi:hypothetical protein
MDLGEKLVRFDNVDGDGANGYGYNGTLSWADTWTTDYTYYETGNLCGADPNVLYPVQIDGKLTEITDSVFYNNLHADAYTESDARGVTVSGGSNPAKNNVVTTSSPIQGLSRGPAVVKGGKVMLPVISINPCAANDAVNSVYTAPDDGFFTPAQYRGGFSPCDNWLEGWSAVDAYGMLQSLHPACSGDLNGDGGVNFSDFADFANNWLQ